MATARDGVNPGRQGGAPARQDPAPKRKGRTNSGVSDPTVEKGQLPSEIFGMPTGINSTGAPGSSGGQGDGGDVTVHPGQLTDSLGHSTDEFITSSGAPGSEGAHDSNGGPDRVVYTDPWGIIGGVTRDQEVSAHIDGIGDWTQANEDGYAAGPTLPGLHNNRPTSSGAGQGKVHGPHHPNAGQ